MIGELDVVAKALPVVLNDDQMVDSVIFELAEFRGVSSVSRLMT